MFGRRRFTIRSKIMSGYVVILLFLVMALMLLSARITSMEKAIDFITDHDIEVHNLANQIEKTVIDMSAGQRGYVITGDDRYLEPYANGKNEWSADFERLYGMVADNPDQQRKLEGIKSEIQRWIDTAGDPTIAYKRAGDTERLDAMYRGDVGKNILDPLRSQLEQFRNTEVELTQKRVDKLDRQNNELQITLTVVFLFIVAISIVTAIALSGSIVRTIKAVISAIADIEAMEGAGAGKRIVTTSRDEVRDLGEATNRLLDSHEREHWLQSGIAEMAVSYQGQAEIGPFARAFVAKLAELLGADYGLFYLRTGDLLTKRAAYAATGDQPGTERFRLGEGLVGQCAAERRAFVIDEVPDNHMKIATGLGESAPRSILIFPIEHEGKVEGVIELASLGTFTPLHLKLAEQVRGNLGMAVNNVMAQMEVKRLLEESQTMSEELQAQTEELTQQTEELRAQSEELTAQQDELKATNDALRKSEERLKRQQEELEDSNLELQKRSELILDNARRLRETNERVEQQNHLLEMQASDLMTASRYKSEFLANMSHELRTPLNSLLILSQLLAENKEGNLEAKQIEFAQTIHSAGGDLLRLIDDILDLSKVEAGQMNVELRPVSWDEILDSLQSGFQPVADQKRIDFVLQVEEPEAEKTLVTDAHRLLQILKNLLSNAFKFTNRGQVKLEIYRSARADVADAIAFEVSDTGIGIPEEKQKLIFEAFQQADGSTSRKYGGTGLGLTISRELATLLGGRIEVESREGEGSRFTLFLPSAPAAPAAEDEASTLGIAIAAAEEEETAVAAPPAIEVLSPIVQWTEPELLQRADVPDDRHDIQPGDRTLLIIEDDAKFSKVMLELARSRKFKGIVALQGDQGLALAKAYKPDAIILDIQLPVIDGWSILDRLKQHPELRHIPVHVISVVDEPQQGLTRGAMAYLRKPVDREGMENAFSRIETFLDRSLKRLLIVEDDAVLRDSMVELMGHDDVAISAVSTGHEALRELEREHFDCMVMDLGLADISGFELLDRIRKNENLRQLPIIIYTGKELDRKEEIEIKKYAESIIIKNVKSQERLFDETALFLHRVEANLPEDRRSMLKKLYHNETAFEGKRLLLVEDDIRNIFALTNVLQSNGLDVAFAENGREALELLEQDAGFDLVLMDIMMPEMDGYQTMKAIRSMPRFEQLPIIALTAKAMKEDRQRCIEAGASDYISKPIDVDKLLSLLKVWLYH